MILDQVSHRHCYLDHVSYCVYYWIGYHINTSTWIELIPYILYLRVPTNSTICVYLACMYSYYYIVVFKFLSKFCYVI